MDPTYVIDCHIEVEPVEGNLVYANGNHQVALTAWLKVTAGNIAASPDVSTKFLENVQLSLIDVESGSPLGAEWIWSMEKKYPTPVKRADGEAGSRPADETGYIKKKIYLAHTLDHKNQGSVLIGVQAAASVEAGQTIFGRSNKGARIHYHPVQKYTSQDFKKTGPFYNTGLRDDVSKWSIDPDQRNLWRSANFLITFTNPEKKVSQVIYNGNSVQIGSDSYPIYSTRRAHCFETAAYVWAFEDALDSRQEQVALPFPDNPQVETINFADGGGFTISLVTFVRTDVWCKDDSAQTTGTLTIDVWDEGNTATTLFLNPIIPNTWNLIKQNLIYDTNQTFTDHMVSDTQITLEPTTKYECLLKNEKYGYAVLDQGYIYCENGTPTAFGPQWAGNTNQVKFQIYNSDKDLAEGYGWYSVSYFWDGQGNYVSLTQHSDYVGDSKTWALYPRWDKDGFCVSIVEANQELYSLNDGGSWNHMLYLDPSNSGGDNSMEYIWYFTPQGA